MKTWLLVLPLLLLGAGAPSQDPSTGILKGTTFATPVIQAVNCTTTPDTLTASPEDDSLIECIVTHTGYLGNMIFALKCADGLAADEYVGSSPITRGERIDDTHTRYSTNGCQRNSFDTAGSKAGVIDVYPGNATSVRTCTGVGAPPSGGDGCGLGFELISLYPLLVALHRRRRSSC